MFRVLSSDFFIDRSLDIINMSYSFFGMNVTNFLVNRTIMNTFTSGNTIASLLKDVEHYRQKHTGSLSGYVIEALTEMHEDKIETTLQTMVDTIVAQNMIKGGDYYCLKYTSMITGVIMTKLSSA